MFKGILPLRRIVSGDFQMLTGTTDSAPNGKENCPSNVYSTEARPRNDKPKKRSKPSVSNVLDLNDVDPFDKLLDELQIPTTIRQKLATMDPGVKAAMLKSSKVLAVMKEPGTPPRTPGGLRKAHSSESLTSPRPQQKPSINLGPSRPSEGPRFATGHFRGMSVNLNQPPAEYKVPASPTKAKDKRPKTPKPSELTPQGYCAILLSTSSTDMPVETVKKLRLLLRNEAASWTQEFLKHGGYSALLTRLDDILDVEWREEQHDDQILHELLRCFKGLATSSIGCFALRSSCPKPFSSLMTLLYSDKRPGEVGTRQLIVELMLTLFDIYPPSSLPSVGSPTSMSFTHMRSRSVPWEEEVRPPTSSTLVTLPAPHTTLFSLIRELLLIPAPPSAEAPETTVEPHAFIEELHRPRIYKTYLQELNDICRDYFWVFCHPNNTVWNLLETDEAKVEKPRAPGGMTGGVEFEAMGYMTMHFKFLNALSKAVHDLKLPKEHEHSAYRFHADMFLSGVDRILLIARKASTTYYPTLHLEIARYVSYVGRSGFELPWALSRIIGSPPTAMKKIDPSRSAKSSTTANNGRASAPGSPSRRGPARESGAPVVPTPRKVTPMFG